MLPTLGVKREGSVFFCFSVLANLFGMDRVWRFVLVVQLSSRKGERDLPSLLPKREHDQCLSTPYEIAAYLYQLTLVCWKRLLNH